MVRDCTIMLPRVKKEGEYNKKRKVEMEKEKRKGHLGLIVSFVIFVNQRPCAKVGIVSFVQNQ